MPDCEKLDYYFGFIAQLTSFFSEAIDAEEVILLLHEFNRKLLT